MSLKISDAIPRFDGSGDVSAWIKQTHLAKRLLKLEDLAVVTPLLLSGDALAVYDQLTELDQADANKIEAALLKAFATDAFSAYNQFKRREWLASESVDVYLADLKRLSKLAGFADSEQIIKLAFVSGLSPQVSARI